MRGSKLRMGVIKKYYFVVTSECIKALLGGVGYRVEEGRINRDKGDIFLG